MKGDTQNAGNVYWFDALIAKGIADPQRNPDHGLSIADHRKGKPDWDVAWFHRYLLAKGDTGKSD